MSRKKTDPDVKALKRAVNALLSSSSEQAARAAAVYIYDTFVVHPQAAREYFARRQSAQQKMQSTDGTGSDKSALSDLPGDTVKLGGVSTISG